MVLATGHGFALDWWTFGVFAFELMSGKPPFESNNPMQIYVRVLKGLRKAAAAEQERERENLPEIGRSAADLIKQLLRSHVTALAHTKEHRWFGSINWRLLVELRFEPPYVPRVKHKRDLSNFHPHADDLPHATDNETW
eukprot:Skav235141  [mRNA]  locus=scaffold1072:28143:31163:+ [translate_table: standard]